MTLCSLAWASRRIRYRSAHQLSWQCQRWFMSESVRHWHVVDCPISNSISSGVTIPSQRIDLAMCRIIWATKKKTSKSSFCFSHRDHLKKQMVSEWLKKLRQVCHGLPNWLGSAWSQANLCVFFFFNGVPILVQFCPAFGSSLPHFGQFFVHFCKSRSESVTVVIL